MSKTRDFSAEEIADTVNDTGVEGFLLPIPTSDNEDEDFCIVIMSQQGVNSENTIYSLSFVSPPKDIENIIFDYKTWGELEEETNVMFTRMVNTSPKNLKKDSRAELLVPGRETFIKIIDMCEDIADSISIGGYEPLETGELFKKYYTPKDRYVFTAPAMQQGPN